MASLGNYYINASILDYASGVFTDAALTTLAPDAYYSNGLIVRQQVGGILMPAQGCDSCTDANIYYYINKNVEASCSSAIFNMNLKIDQGAPLYNVNFLNYTAISNTTGYTNIPTGMTKITFTFTYNTSSCTRMQSYIVLNGVVVATQQFPILVGGNTYSLSYITNMTINSSLGVYVSNY